MAAVLSAASEGEAVEAGDLQGGICLQRTGDGISHRGAGSEGSGKW